MENRRSESSPPCGVDGHARRLYGCPRKTGLTVGEGAESRRLSRNQNPSKPVSRPARAGTIFKERTP